MSLEKVKEEIISKAKQNAEAILKEGRDESAEIMKKAEEKIKENREKIKDELKKIEAAIKKKEIASSELEIKKLFLEEKKRAIENVFDEAKKKIKALSENKREEHIKRLIEKAKKEIDVSYIYCNKKDKGFVEDFEVEEREILGGVIAENSNRDVRVDYSYETLLEGAKEKYLQDLGKVLFG